MYFVFLYINYIEKIIDYLKENKVDNLLVKINVLEQEENNLLMSCNAKLIL